MQFNLTWYKIVVKIKCKKRKEERQNERGGKHPPLSIILYCLSAVTMIILYSKKSNTNFKEKLQIYLETINYCNLECPHCHSHDLIKWGFYERNVIFFSNDSNQLKTIILKVQRVRCSSCGKTHALLPFGIIPYKQFTDEIISQILSELTCNSLNNVLNKYPIEQSVVKKWIKQYNKRHKSKVNVLTMSHNNKKSLIYFLNNYINKISYINKYNQCFMQNKLTCLGLCVS